MVSEARLRANRKWDAEHTERITVKINKDTGPTKEQIKAAAAAAGMSLNAFIIEAIREKL